MIYPDEIRDAIFDLLTIAKTAVSFTLNDWDLKQGYFPAQSVVEIAESNGIVWVVVGTFDTHSNKTRGNHTATREFQVQIGIQFHWQGVGEIEDREDKAVRLQTEIRDIIREGTSDMIPGLIWVSDECLRDSSKVPYSFRANRETNVFEQYFTINFKTEI